MVMEQMTLGRANRGVAMPLLSNFGKLEPERLCFDGRRPTDAFITTPVMYPPYLMLGVSGYDGSLPFTSGFCREGLGNDSVEKIIIDDTAVHDEVKRYMEETSKKHAQVEYYGGAAPIFEYYKIAQQVDGIYNNIVSFKKGGYIKIDVTEALTVIDINSGKFKGVDDVENSLLNLNMNAAKEVARQIILRNIGGLIVVDFIDMQEYENRKKVKEAMDEELSKSKMYFKTLEISEYGLMEITRKRDSKRIDDESFMECPRCSGRGRVLNEESVCINTLKKIKYTCRQAQGRNISVMMPQHVKGQLEKFYKDKLKEYERRYNKKIAIKVGDLKEDRT